jgi:hypothetical protein
MSETKPARPFLVWLLIVLQLLLGVGALGGGGQFIAAPDGSIINMPISVLQNSPFKNYLIPGLILFVFVGLFPVAVAYSLWKLPAWRWPNAINPFKKMHWSWAASLAAGAIVLIWITVEVQFMTPVFIHFFYLGWGIVLILLTLLPAVRRYAQLPHRD